MTLMGGYRGKWVLERIRYHYYYYYCYHYYKSIHIAPHEEQRALQQIKQRRKNREQKLWKQVSFQLLLEHRQGL